MLLDDLPLVRTCTQPVISSQIPESLTIPQLYLALLSVTNPQKFSLASLVILSQSNTVLRNTWYRLCRSESNLVNLLVHLKRLYAGLDLKSDFDIGTLPYPSEKTCPLQGMEIS